MSASPRVTAVALSFLGGLSASVPASVSAEELRIQVITVRATNAGPCDARLEALKPRLRRVSGYRGFEMVDDVSRTVGVRSETEVPLEGGRSLKLLPKRLSEGTVQMQVRLLDGRRRLVDTNLRMQNGGTMVFGLEPESNTAEEATLFVLKASDIQ